MEVGVLGHPETEYWFRIKRGNKKSVKDLESEIYVCVSINLSHKSRKVSFALAFRYEQARLDLRMLQ